MTCVHICFEIRVIMLNNCFASLCVPLSLSLPFGWLACAATNHLLLLLQICCDELQTVMVPLPDCASGEWGPTKATRLFGLVPITHQVSKCMRAPVPAGHTM